MTINLSVINTLALTLATIICMIVALAIRPHVRFIWFIVVLEVLLFTLLIRRLDTIGAWFGLDVISTDVNDFIISWLVIITLAVAGIKAWKRREELDQVEALHREHEAQRAAQMAEHETRMARLVNWQIDEAYVNQTERLNQEIADVLALKNG